MNHRIHIQAAAGSRSIGSRRRQARRRKAFSNKQNDPERFADHPVLKVKNAQSGEGEETKQRE
jgi:hypothetical protein